jgi:hypothetical protein
MAAPCSCTGPGFCERHGFRKSKHLYEVCRTNEKYRAHWDAIVRPPRTEEEQSRIMLICQSCAEYISADDGCKKCGCSSSRREALASKRRIGRCPVGKW